MTALQENIAAYESMLDVLEVDHRGKWVIFHNGEFVASFDDFQDASGAAVKRFGEDTFLLRRVGTAKFHMPGSLLFRPV